MWGVVCAATNRDAQGDDIRQHQLGQYPVVKRAGFCPGCFFVVFGVFFLLLLSQTLIMLFASYSPQRNPEGDTHMQGLPSGGWSETSWTFHPGGDFTKWTELEL